MKPLGEKLEELGDLDLGDPIGSIGVLADYVGGRIQREVRPDRITMAHDELSTLRRRRHRPGQAAARRSPSRCCASTSKEIMERQFQQKRLADAVSDIYAQIAVLSRVTAIFEDQGVEPSGQERYIAETFCTRAAQPRERRSSTRSSATTTSG